MRINTSIRLVLAILITLSPGFAWAATGCFTDTAQCSGGGTVRGHNTATSGSRYGVIGSSDSVNGTGVYGSAMVNDGNITYGVYGVTRSEYGSGVLGSVADSFGAADGVVGLTQSEWGAALKGPFRAAVSSI